MKILKFINTLESSKIKTGEWLLTFFSAAFIRNFLEGLMEKSHTIGTNDNILTSAKQIFMVYNLEWITLILAVMLTAALFSGEKIIKILKLSVYFVPLIIIVPLIDFAVYFPKGSSIEYIHTSAGYINALLGFFLPWRDIGVSAGVRLEVFVAVILTAVYIYAKKLSLFKSLCGAAAVYFLSVSSMCFPVFFLLPAAAFNPEGFNTLIQNFLNDCPTQPAYLDRISLMILYLLIAYLAAAFYIYNKKMLRDYIKYSVLTPLSLFLPVSYIFGFLSASSYGAVFNGCPFFQSNFAWFYLLSGVIFAFLSASAISTGLKEAKYPPAVLLITFLIPNLFSLNISFAVFLLGIAAFSVFAPGILAPFNRIIPKTAFYALILPLICVIFYIAGFSSVYGVKSPQFMPWIQTFAVFILSSLLCSILYLRKK